MNNKGQTTILFSLMISVLFVFTLVVLEVGRICMSTVKINPCVHSMRSSIMADYNEELFERYHLLFLDPTYGTGSEAVAEEKIVDYLETCLNGEEGSAIYQFTLEEVALAKKEGILENDMKLLKQQVADYEKTAGLINKALELADEISSKQCDTEKAAQETAVNGQELDIPNSADNDSLEDSSDSEKKKSDVRVEDPRNILKKSIKMGVLAFVLPNQEVSRQTYNFNKAPSAQYQETKKQEHNNRFDDINFLKSFLDEFSKEDAAGSLIEHAAFADYITSHFSNQINQMENSVMKCETEYVIAGQESDYDNLEAVVNDIIWLRMPVNYAYLLTDTEKKSQALTLASAICVATGTEAFTEVVKYLLLGCWAYGESLYEMRFLLAGDKVAYVKTADNWYTDLETLTAVNNVAKQEQGLSYEDYLMILLAKKSGNELDSGYARMLDAIELNLKQNNPTLRISDCVGGLAIQGKISINSMFQESEDSTLYDHYFETSFSYEGNE